MEEQTINNINVKPQTLRKLASIQIINQINPHTNAEKLLLAMILGWQVVINKEENLKVGDKVIYFEIDSILPEGEEWSKFMEKCKYRVKTIKLRGELSQGLIIPLEKVFPKIDREFNEGDDLTNLLKLTKYDGTSSTFIYDDSKTEFIVCSRNQKLEESKEDLYWKTARKYNIEEILKKNPDFILQGEIYGPKINGNKLNVKEVKLVIFNVFSKELNKGLDYEELVSFCKVNSLEYASLMTSGDSFNETVSSLLEMVKGNYPNTNTPREGFVFRLKKNWDNSRRCSFKVINNDYLLKKDK